MAQSPCSAAEMTVSYTVLSVGVFASGVKGLLLDSGISEGDCSASAIDGAVCNPDTARVTRSSPSYKSEPCRTGEN